MIRLACALLAAALGALLAACGAASPSGGRSHTATGLLPANAPPGNSAAAQADAANLVQRLRLPSGSKQHLCTVKPHVIEANEANALSQRCFTAPGGEDAVYAYVKQHPPGQSKIFATGSGGNAKTGTHSWSVIFSFPTVGHTLGDRLLSVDISADSKGTARVHAVAQSNWIVPRPAAEMIPSGVTEVRVVDGARTLTVTEPARVAAVVQLFDSLPIVQPVTMNCPAFASHHQVIVDFMAGGSGPVLARAKIPRDAAVSECYPIEFSVGGKPMKGLIGVNVRGRLQHLLGIRLP